MDKLRVPVTVCTVYHSPGHNIAASNGQCPKVYNYNGKQNRCRGIMGSAIGVDDWMECPSCGATGSETLTGKRCTQCEGEGWLFVRGILKRLR